VPGRVDPDHSLPQIAKLNEDNGSILPRPAALPLIAVACRWSLLLLLSPLLSAQPRWPELAMLGSIGG
jgi:hypothetical protein